MHIYLKNCTFCQFHNVKSSSQLMAALPKERLISGERAFHATGCDFFGPIFVTEFWRKIKSWGCIFVCFATRAVHLEVCYNMICDSFLEGFFRFLNTRGHATRCIWCDNGTNLKAGSKALTHSFERVKWSGWSISGAHTGFLGVISRPLLLRREDTGKEWLGSPRTL